MLTLNGLIIFKLIKYFKQLSVLVSDLVNIDTLTHQNNSSFESCIIFKNIQRSQDQKV